MVGIRAEAYFDVEAALQQYEKGAVASDIAKDLGIPYHTARRYLEILCDENRAKRARYRKGGAILYQIEYTGIMPALTTLGEGPPIPISKMIAANIKDPNELLIVKRVKRFPLYLAAMARLAAQSQADDPVERPNGKEWDDLRIELQQLLQRTTLMANHVQKLLDTKGLWSNKTAFELWFGDAHTPFTPEEAIAFYQRLNELLADH